MKTKVIKRTIIFIVVAFIDILTIFSMISVFVGAVGDNDITYAVKSVEEDYYEGNYPDMIDELELYDMYSSDFDKYWEAADAYNLCYLYRLYKDSGDEAKAMEYYGQLKDMLNNCQFDENVAIISGFIG